MSASGRDPIAILDVPFAPLRLGQAVARIRAMVQSGHPHQVVLANAHTLNCAHRDPDYRRVLQRAALVLRDGVGVEVAGALTGERMEYNFVGTDFVPRLLERLAEPEVRVFLFGAASGVAAAAAAAFRRRDPGIEIVGVAPGDVRRPGLVAQIRAAEPDVLLVALGNPLQELWIAEHLEALDVPVALGVGALFDYLAGRVRRAPRWLRRLRGEWIFRMAIEPRRLWRRYLVGNPEFLWHVCSAALHRPRPASSQGREGR